MSAALELCRLPSIRLDKDFLCPHYHSSRFRQNGECVIGQGICSSSSSTAGAVSHFSTCAAFLKMTGIAFW
jgi:hypothetical protein